jgi:hypothetical protein
MKKKTKRVTLPDDFFATERGNTMIVTEDGAMAAWIHLGNDRHLEITDTPGNYPRLCVALVGMPSTTLRKHVNKLVKREGWILCKNNIP